MDFLKKNYKLLLFAIPVVSMLLHWHVFKLDLVGIHVWRQTETQTVINNFYRHDFNILNPRINDHADTSQLHRMEFPLLQWLIALLYKIFGQSIVITRAVIFIIGLCSVYGMYYLCNNIFRNKGIAAICAWCFNWSPVFYYYTVNPMPDNMALCAGIWCIGFFYKYINTASIKYVVYSALCLCLATLTKLPFIIYGSFIFAFIIIVLKRKELTFKEVLNIALIYIVCLLPALAWYIAVIPGWEIGAVRGVIDQSLNHPVLSKVIMGTLVSVLPELLINYASVLFFLSGFYFVIKHKKYRNKYFPAFLFWGIIVILYFLFEMNIIDLVHDYYLFPFLPPIFLLVAYGAAQLLSGKKPVMMLAALCLAILPLTAFLRADSRWETKDPGFNPAYFKYKNELRALVPQNALCVVGNDESHYILLYYIDRKGWAFDQNWMDGPLLSSYISKGAKYLFVDSPVDTSAGIKTHLQEKIFEKETLRVYKLK